MEIDDGNLKRQIKYIRATMHKIIFSKKIIWMSFVLLFLSMHTCTQIMYVQIQNIIFTKKLLYLFITTY